MKQHLAKLVIKESVLQTLQNFEIKEQLLITKNLKD